MGTKNNPGKFDCYSMALPDEPMFILLARDNQFFKLVMEWARDRELAISCGDRPPSDNNMVTEAKQCAFSGQNWRRANNGIWRK